MRISETVYAALEAVVGADNISAKEYVLAGNRVKTPEIPPSHINLRSIKFAKIRVPFLRQNILSRKYTPTCQSSARFSDKHHIVR